MKIKKFNESTSSGQPSWKGYWVFAVNDDISKKNFESDLFLFENQESAFNFLVNRMYEKFKEQDIDFEELDDIIVDFKSTGFSFDVESLHSEYIDILQKYDYFDNISLDYLEPNNKQELEDWVQKRITLKLATKKYNM